MPRPPPPPKFAEACETESMLLWSGQISLHSKSGVPRWSNHVRMDYRRAASVFFDVSIRGTPQWASCEALRLIFEDIFNASLLMFCTVAPKLNRPVGSSRMKSFDLMCVMAIEACWKRSTLSNLNLGLWANRLSKLHSGVMQNLRIQYRDDCRPPVRTEMACIRTLIFHKNKIAMSDWILPFGNRRMTKQLQQNFDQGRRAGHQFPCSVQIHSKSQRTRSFPPLVCSLEITISL